MIRCMYTQQKCTRLFLLIMLILCLHNKTINIDVDVILVKMLLKIEYSYPMCSNFGL